MLRELLMPKLGLTMIEGLVADWIVQPGEPFGIGSSLVVIETDKVANEIPADAAGTFHEIVVPAGQSVAVGEVIGYWDDGQEGEQPPTQAVPPKPVVTKTAVAIGPSTEATASIARKGGTERVIASPLARRLAKQRGIALEDLCGSGPKGRIVARDVPTAVLSGQPVSRQQATPAEPSQLLIKPTSLQTTVARRLTQGKQETPHFYLALEAEVSRLVEMRREINDGNDGPRLTLNHFIVFAVARALRNLPEANRVWTADGILAFNRIDVGIAVNTERGLLAPAVCDVGNMSIGDLARSLDALTARARAGTLLPQDNGSPAITVSNAGMHNVTYMTSIINPGQAMILGVGSIKEVFRPDATGLPVLRREMGLVLSADHRIMDGVAALKFLNAVAGLLERPAQLLVG